MEVLLLFCMTAVSPEARPDRYEQDLHRAAQRLRFAHEMSREAMCAACAELYARYENLPEIVEVCAMAASCSDREQRDLWLCRIVDRTRPGSPPWVSAQHSRLTEADYYKDYRRCELLLAELAPQMTHGSTLQAIGLNFQVRLALARGNLLEAERAFQKLDQLSEQRPKARISPTHEDEEIRGLLKEARGRLVWGIAMDRHQTKEARQAWILRVSPFSPSMRYISIGRTADAADDALIYVRDSGPYVQELQRD